jgi:hypothetical protein
MDVDGGTTGVGGRWAVIGVERFHLVSASVALEMSLPLSCLPL